MIKEIQASETYWVRQEVLRKGKPIETCHFEGDDAVTTMHFGIELNKKIIGIEEFNKLVLKDLNSHQSKLNTHEDWLKSINRR